MGPSKTDPGTEYQVLNSWFTPALALVAAVAIYASGSNGGGLRTFGTLILTAAAAFFLGALLGFVLAIPMTRPRSDDRSEFQANTALEEFSRWVVTLFAGASLATGSTLLQYFADQMAVISKELGLTTSAAPALISITASVAGFACAYYWTKTRYPYLLERSNQLRAQLSRGFRDFRQFNLDDSVDSKGRQTWEIKTEYLTATHITMDARAEDPCSGRFGGQAKIPPYEVQASCSAADGGKMFRTITLKVSASQAQADRKLGIFLHPSFIIDALELDFPDLEVVYTFRAWGAFTVGLVVKESQANAPLHYVPLEFDLSKSTGADAEFNAK